MMYDLTMLIISLCMNIASDYPAQKACQVNTTTCYHRIKAEHPNLSDDSIVAHCVLE